MLGIRSIQLDCIRLLPSSVLYRACFTACSIVEEEETIGADFPRETHPSIGNFRMNRCLLPISRYLLVGDNYRQVGVMFSRRAKEERRGVLRSGVLLGGIETLLPAATHAQE